MLDADVIVAAMRSPSGASAALLLRRLARPDTLLLTVGLAMEYEAVRSRPEHVLAIGGNQAKVANVLDAIMRAAVPVEVHYLWRPQLSGAGDEMALEAAVNGRADAIITFNRKDYGAAPSQYGIEVLLPSEALKRIRR